MSDEALDAKAEAKAAKARAKALRPWFKKKRFWLLGTIGLIVIISIANGGGGNTPSATPTQKAEAPATTIGTGLGTKDASADVDDVSCSAPDSLGLSEVSVKVTNRSSKASDYFVTVSAESANGLTRYDNTVIMITNLQPNQTTTEKGLFTNELPAGTICKVTEVQRTAS